MIETREGCLELQRGQVITIKKEIERCNKKKVLGGYKNIQRKSMEDENTIIRGCAR